ncbi:MAG: YihY/virulence factor BrkB family protein [Prevotella sp.]|nr:YihY/virulence factor BrkB family protein [Prevotella sp.]
MKDIFTCFITFLKVDVWQMSHKNLPVWRKFMYSIIKKLIIVIRFFTKKMVMRHASALTYSTLLSIVPILAVVFAIARGFGYGVYIEDWFMSVFDSQPQAAEILTGFVNSYLDHTSSGVVLGFGMIFMFYTVFMLVSNIEGTFNEIWQVKAPRGVFRMFTDYFAMILLFPVIIVLISGVSIYFAAIGNNMPSYIQVLGPVMRFFVGLLPYIIMSAVFIGIYVFIPNTHVEVRHAIVPGIIAGVAMQWLQFFYIHSQIWVSSYNAIYGSFAALPLFMLWLQISWTICLFGATLCYANQNVSYYDYDARTSDISHRYRIMLCAMLASRIFRRFDCGLRPYTSFELCQETKIPIRIVNDLLYEMIDAHILMDRNLGEKGEDTQFVPNENIEHFSLGVLIDRLESRQHWKLNLPLREVYNDNWRKALAIRRTYLKQSKEILLKDL